MKRARSMNVINQEVDDEQVNTQQSVGKSSSKKMSTSSSANFLGSMVTSIGRFGSSSNLANTLDNDI